MHPSLEDFKLGTMGVTMAIIAPKARKHLAADALFRVVRRLCTTLPEHRIGEVTTS